MKIKKASIDDAINLTRICRKNKFETDSDWKEILESKKNEVFLLVDGKKIIGFTGLTKHTWNNTLQIIDVFINPEFRRRGLGLKLIRFLKERAKKTKFRCLIAEAPSSNPVVKLYKKAGFRKCGYNDRYYSNSGKEIALWMSFDLK